MNDAVEALGLIKAGDWDAAHTLIQDGSDKMACLIHAYLHRDEGDMGNASYWYQRAGEIFPDNSLAEELARLSDLVS